MLEKKDILKVLGFFNQVVQDTLAQLCLREEEVFHLINQDTFGRADTLNPNHLLQGLLRRAFQEMTSPSRGTHLPFPPVTTQYSSVHYEIRERRLRTGRTPVLAPPEQEIGKDSVAGTILTATPLETPVQFTGKQLFNAFVALGLRWALRDSQARPVRWLTDYEVMSWMKDGHLKLDPAGSLQLSDYPSQRDREKIKAFLAIYGPRFLPGTLSTVPTHTYPGISFIPPGSPDLHFDFFPQFAAQYHYFLVTEMILMRQLFPDPSVDEASGGLWDLAVGCLTRQLSFATVRFQFPAAGTIATTVPLSSGLQICYGALLEQLLSKQPTLRPCGLPACPVLFFPRRKDQACCCPPHAHRLRFLRFRLKQAHQ